MQLSLIIPTRNRLNYLERCLPFAVKHLPRGCEIIVGENNCDDGTKDYLRRFCDSLVVKVLASEKTLSMSENFERCIKSASGMYVLVIGDDDLIVPGQLDNALIEAQRLGWPDAILQPDWCMVWPQDVKRQPGSLDVEIGLHSDPFSYSLDQARVRAVKEINYTALPDVYHGIVKRNVYLRYSRLVERSPFIKAPSPDVYLAFALSCFVGTAFVLPKAYSVKGQSPLSNGASLNSGKNTQRVEEFLNAAKRQYSSKSGNCFISNLHEHLLCANAALNFVALRALKPSWFFWAWKSAKHSSRCPGSFRFKLTKIRSFLKYALTLSFDRSFGRWGYHPMIFPLILSAYCVSYSWWSIRLLAKNILVKMRRALAIHGDSQQEVLPQGMIVRSPDGSFLQRSTCVFSYKYRHAVRRISFELPVSISDCEIEQTLECLSGIF